jgi:YD repeat-containing protein
MSLISFPSVSKPGSSLSRRRRGGKRPGKRLFRPAIQHLEDRMLLSTDYWTGASAHAGGNDNWSNAGNWSAGLPGASTTVDFTSSESQFGTAIMDTATTVAAVDIDSTWGGTLTVSNPLTISGNFTLASGTLNGSSTISASGSASQWSGGTINFGTGSLSNAGTLTIATNNGNLNLTGTLTNTGSIAVTGTDTIYAQNAGATIDNQLGGTFDFQAGATLNINGLSSSTFNNAGTLEQSTGTGTATISFPVADTGTIQGNSGTLLLTGNGSGGTTPDPGLVNAGTTGTVILGGSYSGTFAGSGAGSVVLSDFTGANATLNFSGTVLEWANIQNGPDLAGTVTNAGALTIATTTSGNNPLDLAGTLTNTGSIVVTGTNNILAVASGTTIYNQSGATFDFQSAAILNTNGETSTAFSNAGTLERTTGTGTASISFPVADSGKIESDSGTLEFTGGGSGGPGIVNAGASGSVILGGTFSGTLTGSGAGSVVLSGFTGGTFDFQGAAYLNSNSETGTVFNNAGTLSVTDGSASATISFPVNDSGTIQGNLGVLYLTGGGSGGNGTSAGIVNSANGSTVVLSGTYSGAFIGSGTGAVDLSNFTGTNATLDFSGSVLQWTPTQSGRNLAGTVTNSGAMIIATTTAGNNPVNLYGALINTGSIIVTGDNEIYAQASGATITNQPGGTFDFQGTGTLSPNGFSGPTFNNAGVLERSTGSGTATISFPVSNTGTIVVDAGTLDLTAGGGGGGNSAIFAAAGGTVILSGSYSGSFAGSGPGSVQLSNFTGGGSGVTLDFTGSVLQWIQSNSNLGGIINNTGTLTISGASGLPLTGTLTNSGTIIDANTGQVYANASGTTINNEAGATFDITVAATLNVNGQSNTAFNNDGTLEISSGTGQSQIGFPMGGAGNVLISSGSLEVDSGTLEFDNSESLSMAPSASLVLDGNLSGSTSNADQFAPEGDVLFNGSGTSSSPQLLEAMSQDLGNVATGFLNNFAYGTLSLGNGTYVQLTDISQNVTAAGTNADAVYVNYLVVPNGTTLDLHGLHLYARQTNISGTILGGTVNTLPAGGPLFLNSPAPGFINSPSQVDTWTFYGQAGQTEAVVVDTGSSGSLSPLVPTLGYAQVQVLDPNGNVVASGTNTQQGADVTLAGITLALNGTYKIEVQVPSGQSGSTGNYLVTEWDANTHANALDLGETENGQLNSLYASDQWSFSAPANESVQFNLTASSSSAIEFSLTGPNGYTAFSNQTGSSGLINLPAAGSYTMTAHLAADQPGAYAFNVAVSSETALTPGTPFNGTLAGDGQEQLFTVTLASPAALSIVLSDSDAQDQNELYVSSGAAPTRDTFQYSASGAGANQTVALSAQPGTYHILVYNSLVTSPGSQYSLEVQAPPFVWTGFTPGKVGSATAATLLVSGVFPLAYQSATAYQIQFVGSGGSVFPSTPLYLAPTSLGSSSSANGTQSLTATLPAGTLAAGTYSVKITDSLGNTQTMTNALSVTAGGTGVLSTKLIIPTPIGFHYASTLYVEYTNTGTAPMAAPLLVLTATIDGQQGAFLSLDPSLAGHYYSSNSMPAGLSPTVQFVASGSIPGVLEPGESVTVPVYQDGWLLSQQDLSGPPIIFTVSELSTTNTSTIDWSSLEASMRPSYINTAAWDAIFPILTANLGSTWGQYLQTLDDDAVYLAGIGEPTSDLNLLLQFEIEKANAAFAAETLVSITADDLPAPGDDLTFVQSFQQSIAGRYTEGILGYGWTTIWDMSAISMANGDVAIENDGITGYFHLQPDGTFAPAPGDQGLALSATAGGYLLTEPNGTIYQFNANGTLDYTADIHGNRITTGYNTQNQLVTLTDSNGEYFHLAYNPQGFLATLTDSTGKTETYNYNSGGQLATYSDEFITRTFTYVTGQSAAQNNALSEISDSTGTDLFFGYDSEGRLVNQHWNGGAENETISYLSPGGYVTTDGDGNQTTTYFNLYGSTVETIDPLGNVTRYEYDSNQSVTQIIGPGGTTSTYAYDSSGNLISETNPLGLTTNFTYSAQNELTSDTDAKGNTTSYAYDSQNDLLSVTYADGTEQEATYNPLGEATQYLSANGQAIGYTYNTLGQIKGESFADGTSYSYTYNALGHLTTATDAQGNVTTFVYADSSTPDLLTEVEYPDGTFPEVCVQRSRPAHSERRSNRLHGQLHLRFGGPLVRADRWQRQPDRSVHLRPRRQPDPEGHG